MPIRVTLIFLEVLLLLLFLAPIFIRVFNIGNLLGILFALCCLLMTIFHKPFFTFLHSAWQQAAGKAVLSVIALLLAVGIGFVGFFSFRMAQHYQNPPETPCTVVVLGCKVRGTTPSLMLQRRLDAAYAYLSEHPDVSCIVSGGKGAGEDISEAQAMYNDLTERGIAPQRIFMEDRSTDTHENLQYSKEILEQQELSMQVTIITDGFHQYRAHQMAEAIGLESWSVSGKTRPVLIPTYWVREWLALMELLLGLA